MDTILTAKFDLELEIVCYLVSTVLCFTSLDSQIRQDLVARNVDGRCQISELAIYLVARLGIHCFIKVPAIRYY